MYKSKVVIAVVFILLTLRSFVLYASDAALLIGVSQYEDSSIPDLKWADSDAKELADSLIRYGGYDERCVATLINSEATKLGIEQQLGSLTARCSVDNTLNHFFIYFAGHAIGGNSFATERAFLMPYDTRRDKVVHNPDGSVAANPTMITKEWLANILVGIPSRSVSVTLDACQSAVPDWNDLIADMGFKNRKVINGVVEYQKINSPDREKEYGLLSATNEQDEAWEFNELKHGALTYGILRKMREFRQNLTHTNLAAPLYMNDMYRSVRDFFNDRRVTDRNGRAIRLAERHLPQLFLFPVDKSEQMIFANISVDKNRQVGYFEISSDYDQFHISMDGENISPHRGKMYAAPIGSRTLVLEIPSTNYRHVLSVEIKGGAPNVFDVSLKGDLRVEIEFAKDIARNRYSSPGTVYLDGKKVGRTGETIRNLVAGTYDMRVDLNGETKSKTVSIRPDSPLRIVYKLDIEDQNKQTEKKLTNLPF